MKHHKVKIFIQPSVNFEEAIKTLKSIGFKEIKSDKDKCATFGSISELKINQVKVLPFVNLVFSLSIFDGKGI